MPRLNRATRLEGLTHSPPLYATRLTRTVSWLRRLSFERPLNTTNKMADQRNFLEASLIFLIVFFIAHSASSLFSVYRTVVLALLIQRKKTKNSPRAAMFPRFISPRIAGIARHEPFTCKKARPTAKQGPDSGLDFGLDFIKRS